MTYQRWYRTGTVTLTNGSAAVTGTVTAWLADVRAGDAISVDGTRWAEIDSVSDNTHLVLAQPWGGATHTGAYMIDRRSVVRQIASDAGARLASYLEQVKIIPPPALASALRFPRVSADGAAYDLIAGLLVPSLAASGADANRLLRANAGGTNLEFVNSALALGIKWLTFIGATGAIQAHSGISSVIRNAAGDYWVTFAQAYANANFAFAGAGKWDAGGGNNSPHIGEKRVTSSRSASSINITTILPADPGATAYDPALVTVVFMGTP